MNLKTSFANLSISSGTNDFTIGEEIANALTHGLAALLSVVGLVFMLLVAIETSSLPIVLGSLVYGTSLILLYLFSTLYHSFRAPFLKRIFRVLDHCAIYILIAGTYTPFLLISLKGTLAYSLLAVIWSIAVIGILIKVFFWKDFKKISLYSYLLMGWLSILVIVDLFMTIPLSGFILLVSGGVVYSLGTIFYALDNVPYNHAIWHVFVIAGSACHFTAIYAYVIPVKLI